MYFSRVGRPRLSRGHRAEHSSLCHHLLRRHIWTATNVQTTRGEEKKWTISVYFQKMLVHEATFILGFWSVSYPYGYQPQLIISGQVWGNGILPLILLSHHWCLISLYLQLSLFPGRLYLYKVLVVSYPGLLTPAFVTCSTNMGECPGTSLHVISFTCIRPSSLC